ncbi:1-deoxy-D-xylulose 5-phosphate reductoisomerase, partial [Hydrogenivirga sp. 128-5-R1-1]
HVSRYVIEESRSFRSTGSVGRQTLDIIRKFKNEFSIKLLAASKVSDELKKQIDEFKPDYVYVENLNGNLSLKNTQILTGKDGIEFYSSLDIDLFINAISGINGIYPTYCILKNNKKLATANKEAIICLGEILKDKYCQILPIDSEHSAIFQLLEKANKKSIDKIIITSSGGPFFKYSKEQLKNVSVEEALKHPKWKMGKKITVDSATLMNKGLEIIEAHYLFDIDYDKIQAVIHPQSIIHGIIEFVDGTLFAALSPTDMRYPISYALFYPERKEIGIEKLDLTKIGKFEFYKPDYQKFPLLKLAVEAGKKGGYYPIVLTVADEFLVDKFLKRKISFLDIPYYIEKILDNVKFKNPKSIDDIFYIADATEKKLEELVG